jgi:hypothetical protein
VGGVQKDESECAPTGYYSIPVYDKGSFVLEVEGPAGWNFGEFFFGSSYSSSLLLLLFLRSSFLVVQLVHLMADMNSKNLLPFLLRSVLIIFVMEAKTSTLS